MNREELIKKLAETFTSNIGVGSDLVDPQAKKSHLGENFILIADGAGGTIDLDHLAEEIESMIEDAVSDAINNELESR